MKPICVSDYLWARFYCKARVRHDLGYELCLLTEVVISEHGRGLSRFLDRGLCDLVRSLVDEAD